ncbi:MAG TPA: hypothetical protein VGB63_11905 [Pedobacter sp.]|jgi:hypothetical protein
MQENLEPFEISISTAEPSAKAKVVPKGDGLYAVFVNNDLFSVPQRSTGGWKDLKEGDKTDDFGSLVELIEKHYAEGL